MKARIIPLADIAEFGKTGSVAVMLVMTPEEAEQILREMTAGDGSPAAVRALYGTLDIVAVGDKGERDSRTFQDVVNTDGRYMPRAEQAEEVDNVIVREPIGYREGIPIYNRLD